MAFEESSLRGENKEGDESCISFQELLINRKISKESCSILIEGGINKRYLF